MTVVPLSVGSFGLDFTSHATANFGDCIGFVLNDIIRSQLTWTWLDILPAIGHRYTISSAIG